MVKPFCDFEFSGDPPQQQSPDHRRQSAGRAIGARHEPLTKPFQRLNPRGKHGPPALSDEAFAQGLLTSPRGNKPQDFPMIDVTPHSEVIRHRRLCQPGGIETFPDFYVRHPCAHPYGPSGER